MNKEGIWRLSRAFDVAYSYNPDGAWTSQHQMSLNGKRDGFVVDDLLALGELAGFKKRKARGLLDEINEAVKHWNSHAQEAGVADTHRERIGNTHRFEALGL